jgi:hypothetical protein
MNSFDVEGLIRFTNKDGNPSGNRSDANAAVARTHQFVTRSARTQSWRQNERQSLSQNSGPVSRQGDIV